MTTISHDVRKSLISEINWRRVGRKAAREVRNRETHAPVISAYRWWARRPHSVMGAILDAAMERYGDDLVVSDPFSGGGTVAFEAVRRGLKAYAQDLYPWPAKGLAAALLPVAPAEFQAAAKTLLATLESHRAHYRRADGRELSHILRVRNVRCPCCDKDYVQIPHPMLSLASRGSHEHAAYFGCSICAGVTKRRRDVRSFACSECGKRFSTVPGPRACPHCCTEETPERPPVMLGWHPVLVQELVPYGQTARAVLRPVQRDDPVDSYPVGSFAQLEVAIPKGKETNRLIRAGFKTWDDLYTGRQARVLLDALGMIRNASWSHNVKERLAFAILGACEMPAFATRWDRLHLKPFETTANHRYFAGGLSVEANLLSPVGRGTLTRRLKASALALEWVLETAKRLPQIVASTSTGRRGRRRTRWDVHVVTGNSVRQSLADASVDLVVTDPPYFDDVQYGELARLFHIWLGVHAADLRVNEQEEAVPNSVRGITAEAYRETIEGCLRESRRTLKPKGRLVLTFHNTKLVAWHILGRALKAAGFSIISLAVVRAESDNDLCKRNVKAMLADLVIECSPAAHTRTTLAFEPRTALERNLAAMGLATSECLPESDISSLRTRYHHILSRKYGDSNPIIE